MAIRRDNRINLRIVPVGDRGRSGRVHPNTQEALDSFREGWSSFGYGGVLEAVDQGRWDCIEIFAGDAWAGVMVLCVDDRPAGKVLEIVAMKLAPGQPVKLKTLWPVLLRMAKFGECNAIEATSARAIQLLIPSRLRPRVIRQTWLVELEN